jgi:hypothetical protein
MKTLDWSVETLGLDYNSTGLCVHLYKPDSASTYKDFSLQQGNIGPCKEFTRK